jgi:hypothetical protein
MENAAFYSIYELDDDGDAVRVFFAANTNSMTMVTH